MIAEVAAGMTALRSAFELAKGVAEIADAATRNAQAIELQKQILAAQQSALAANDAHTALIQRIDALEKEIADLKAWEAEKKRYQLTDIGSGNFALSLKQEEQDFEPPHTICANCYQNSQRSILHNVTTQVGRRTYYICHRCDSTLWPDGGGPELLGKRSGNPTFRPL